MPVILNAVKDHLKHLSFFLLSTFILHPLSFILSSGPPMLFKTTIAITGLAGKGIVTPAGAEIDLDNEKPAVEQQIAAGHLIAVKKPATLPPPPPDTEIKYDFETLKMLAEKNQVVVEGTASKVKLVAALTAARIDLTPAIKA
jgi:hypothetical protein